MWSRLTSNKLNSQGNTEILIFLSYRHSSLYSFKSTEILFVWLSALLYGSDVLVMRSPFGTVNYSFWIYLFSQSLECQYFLSLIEERRVGHYDSARRQKC